ncbi:MAG: nucleotide exchange factor GrpE [Phaeodactylibacter sp.]|nr:nucleotide exchange factor GrpE [Phaeodactylibacter sp.]
MGKKSKEEPIKDQQQDSPEVADTLEAQQADASAKAADNQGGKASEVETLRQQNAELKDKYLRLYAEFDNYKKRTVKEKIEMMKTAAQDTLSALLPVLDDFDRAKKNADDESTTEVFTEGVQLVYNKLHSILKNKGLEAMKSDGEAFDPELHEAFTEIPAPSDDLKGKIVDTIEKGYLLNDRIIRHAKVVIGK